MRLHATALLVVLVAPGPSHGQFFNAIRNIFRPVTNVFQGAGGLFGGSGKFSDDGTQAPQATGKEELFPTDCGRNTDSGTGKLCFPDGLLCRDREYTHVLARAIETWAWWQVAVCGGRDISGPRFPCGPQAALGLGPADTLHRLAEKLGTTGQTAKTVALCHNNGAAIQT